MISLKYRSDIDGLRAVAVLGVVIYHAFPWALPGGFTGVDIFFVISGYLISGILYKRHLQGGFSFNEFYARRVRRLFPALITVLVLTMAYGWVILLPDEFAQLGKHVAAGTLFIQNIVFWQESGYFDTAANLKPLLHLWSLAVEEQFYIFFPLLLILLWKRPKIMVPVMGVLLVVSMAGNLWMSLHASNADFFLTPYRAWEFLGGSLLAWWQYDKGHQHSEGEEVPMYREALSWGGVVLMGMGMVWIQKGQPYPGWRALFPVVGTLLLMEGGRRSWVNRKVLSNPALVWVGLISYPLYLFHWPALSFLHIVKGEDPSPMYLWEALGISLLLAAITYHFIERKIRHNKSKYTLPSLVAGFVLMGVLSILAWKAYITPLSNTPIVRKISQATEDKDMLHGLELMKHHSDLYINRCGGSGPQTLYVGDSNMMQYAPRILELLKNNKGNDRGAILITKGGVAPIPKITRNGILEYSDFEKELIACLLVDQRIDRIVFAARWYKLFNRDTPWMLDGGSLSDMKCRDQALDAFGCSIKRFSNMGKKVILVLAIPDGKELDPKGNFQRTFIGIKVGKPFLLAERKYIELNQGAIDKLKTTGYENGAEVINPISFLCNKGVCIREDAEGVPIRFDGTHLRPGYVREHVKYIDSTVSP
jgi:peptidoglycan/LPS O-acetylase OafA/YrhL